MILSGVNCGCVEGVFGCEGVIGGDGLGVFEVVVC